MAWYYMVNIPFGGSPHGGNVLLPELYVESRAGGREVPDLRARRKYTKRAVLAAGVWHTVGLKKDGTVVAVGQNETRQCSVSDWTDIKLPEGR